MTNDQEHYQNLIDELHRFIKSLQEWQEQCEPLTHEDDCLRPAVNDAIKCMTNLARARNAHLENERARLKRVIFRVSTGTTTDADALFLKRFMP